MVGSGSVGRSRVVGLGLRVGGVSLIGDISNIALIATSGVLDVLGPAIGQGNRVGTANITAVTGLSSVEGSSRVVISHSVLISVGRGSIVLFMVVGGGRLVGGLRVVGSRLVMRGRGVVGWHNSVSNRVRSIGEVRSISTMMGNSSRSTHSYNCLLNIVVGVNSLGSCVGLGGHLGMGCKVRLEDRRADRGSVAQLDGLVVGLVGSSRGHSKQGSEDKDLGNRK